MSVGDLAAGDGQTLTIGGVTYAKGLGAHAASVIEYDLSGGNFATFESDVGVDDECAANGSVVFTVFVDGQQSYSSGTLTYQNSASHLSVDITGASTLRLEGCRNSMLPRPKAR